MKLKEYQDTSLDKLETYLLTARMYGAKSAFYKCIAEDSKQHYKSPVGLEDVPHVCLRIPTGGGKTVLAAHTVKRAARSYMEKDYPVVLWMVPTNTIRKQTLDALRNPRHSYRETLDDAFNMRVAVFDIAEFEQIRPQDFTESVCVIVSTFGALRVDDDKTESRRIYSNNEAFESHFARLPHNHPGLDRAEGGPDKGKVKFSFANLLYLHQPLLIVDEAHNAISPVTIKTWNRINPSCIVEFTATPVNNNTLYSVSASTLKNEQMIKLPIVLTEHTQDWQETLHDAILTLGKLQEIATKEAQLVRPIALIQAEDKGREVTTDVIRHHMIKNEKIDKDRIKIVTGEQKELDGIDLFDPNCHVDFIITVEALKEGWDCSFAYVFCSMANVHSIKDVEQFLGRVLRMPYAKRRDNEELNKAYAHVRSSFAQAAALLVDKMVENMGFDEEEALAAIQPGLPSHSGGDNPLFDWPHSAAPLSFTLEEKPSEIDLTGTDASISVTANHDGSWSVTVHGEVNAQVEQKLLAAVSKKTGEYLSSIIKTHKKLSQRKPSPSERGEQLLIPRLCIWHDGEKELVDSDCLLHAGGWNLLDYRAELPEFSISKTATTFGVDLNGEHLEYRLLNSIQQLDLQHVHTDMNQLSFARQLDRELQRKDVTQEVMMEFIRRTLANLVQVRKFEFTQLVRAKYPLIAAIKQKIAIYRNETLKKGYQDTLFADNEKLEVSFDHSFSFKIDAYCPTSYYRGHWRPNNHFYDTVGAFDSGEECSCAQVIDSLPQVRYWVRNLSYGEDAFWLPRPTGRFYPDFLALLKDDRLLVVEYKGDHLLNDGRTLEANNIGELWEEKCEGKGLYLMVVKEDVMNRNMWDQVLAKI